MIVGTMRAVLRYEGVFDNNVMTAGRSQAQYIPVFLHAEITARKQERRMLELVRIALLRQQPAEEDPLTVINTTGETPAA